MALLSPRFASPQAFVWEQDVCSLRGRIGEDYTLQLLIEMRKLLDFWGPSMIGRPGSVTR